MLTGELVMQKNFNFEQQMLREREERERRSRERMRQRRSDSAEMSVPSEEGRCHKATANEVKSIKTYLDHCIQQFKEIDDVPHEEISIPDFNGIEDIRGVHNHTHTRFMSFIGDMTGITHRAEGGGIFGEKSMQSFSKMSYAANPRKSIGLRVRSANQICLDHVMYFLSGCTERTVEAIMKNFKCI